MTKMHLRESLDKLDDIVQWFDRQDNVDVEEGIKKIKEGVELIKASRERLKEIENEFEHLTDDLHEDKE